MRVVLGLLAALALALLAFAVYIPLTMDRVHACQQVRGLRSSCARRRGETQAAWSGAFAR